VAILITGVSDCVSAVDCVGDDSVAGDWLGELSSPSIRTANAKFPACGSSGIFGAGIALDTSCGTTEELLDVSGVRSVTSCSTGSGDNVEVATAAAASVGSGCVSAGEIVEDGAADGVTAESATFVDLRASCARAGS
jgi:hypothetical protein